MSVYKYDKTNNKMDLVAGGTFYADSPIGVIIPYGGTTAPLGWLLCRGQAISRTEYADLFAVINTAFGSGNGTTTFNLPDLRETAPVGTGTRGNGVTSHDTYTLGQFKDDQLQNHKHATTSSGTMKQTYTASAGDMGSGDVLTLTGRWDSTASNKYTVSKDISVTGTSGNPTATDRHGTVTRGKRLGVNYIIKAKQVALPQDFQSAIEEQNSYSTEETYTGKKWVDGKPIYRIVVPITIPETSEDGTFVETSYSLDSDVELVFDMMGYFKSLPDATYHYTNYLPVKPPEEDMPSNMGGVWCFMKENDIMVRNNNTKYNNRTGHIIVEYTKTTD